ncbi:MAG TPA: three-Cys-motif partner protein TcmP [Methylomirabilota bacterium]|nr:three-Cys-motif partner protein TcmP [Methylomirabilota bacterium]
MPKQNTDFFREKRDPAAWKHAIVGGYLRNALPVLLQRPGTDVVYADLYAGAGRYDDGTPGSPMIAAELAAARYAKGVPPFIRCFNVERDPKVFARLKQATSTISGDIITNFCGEWQDYAPQLAEQIKGRTSVIFLDPFGLDLDFDDLAPFAREVGPEARELIVRLPVFDIRRQVEANAQQYAVREEAAVYGGDIGMPWKNYESRLTALLGGRWWQDLLVDGHLSESAFPDLAEGYCEQLRSLRPVLRNPRRALAVPIPKVLGGTPFYYLVFLTRSPRAVAIYSDAVEAASEDAWSIQEQLTKPQSDFRESQLTLLDAPQSAHLDTYTARRDFFLSTLKRDVQEFVTRRPWGATFSEVHETMALAHVGQFREKHLRAVIAQLRDVDGEVVTDTPAIRRNTRISRRPQDEGARARNA